MKKSLLFSLLAAGALSATAADVVDVIDLDQMQIAAAMEGVEIPDGPYGYGSVFLTLDGDLTESGCSYKVGYLAYNETYLYFRYSGFLTNIDNPNGYYLEKVVYNYPLSSQYDIYSGSVYGRSEAVGFHMDGADNMVPNVGYDYSTYQPYPGNTTIDSNEYDYRNYPVEAPLQYVVCQPCDNKSITIEIHWSKTAPVPQVKTPVLEIRPDATGAYPSGTLAQMTCVTNPCTLNYTITRNGEAYAQAAAELESQWSPVSVALDGEPGDVFDVSCYASREGYTDSETVTASCTLTLPGLRAPEGDMFSSWGGWSAVQNRPYVVRNPNGVGTMYVTVDGVQYAVKEESLELEVLGEVGDTFSISAYITAEGHTPSEEVSFTGDIESNKIATPWISPDTDEVIAGTEISFSSSNAWVGSSIIYRINGGEWIDTGATWTQYYTVTEDVLIEVQVLADTEGEYSYYTDSDIASRYYKIEVLDPETTIVLKPVDFAPDLYAYWDTLNYTTVNQDGAAVDWEYFGNIQSYNEVFTMSGTAYLRNLTEVSDGIYGFKLNQENEWQSNMVLYFSDEVLDIAALPEDAVNNAVAVNWDNNGQWLNLSVYDAENGTNNAGKKYMLLAPGEYMYTQVSRLVVSTDINTQVEGINAAARGVDAVYTVNGVRLDNNQPLAPGLYIKVTDGKAVKVLVK